MRYIALASDYDGTLAHHGEVAQSTVDALLRFRKSGRFLLLVTGRELPELESVFPKLDLFHRVVAENGALLYNPETRQCRRLAEPPPEAFIKQLQEKNVQPLSVGDVIVATLEGNETAVLESIRDLGLELNVIFNKGSVMILPAGVNKVTGLTAALHDLNISCHNIVGIGDAENDHAFLNYCECGAAVANALPAVKETADFVTVGPHGEGVTELIDEIIRDDRDARIALVPRRRLPIGNNDEGEVALPAYNGTLLVTGASGSGKSSFTTGFVERLQKLDYQVCLIDPEGDYEALAGVITIGDEKHPPTVDQVLQALAPPANHVVVTLVGIPIHDRPIFFAHLLPQLEEMRLRTGRPHWIVIDEAHHMFPADAGSAVNAYVPDSTNILLITVHPNHVAPDVLSKVSGVVIIGKQPQSAADAFSQLAHAEGLQPGEADLPPGTAYWWTREQNSGRHIRLIPPEGEHSRHKRKYAHGEIEPERSFYFTGPQGKLKLRAQNVMTFVQLAEGLDEETWSYHRERGEYSKWFRETLKDPELAKEAEAVEKDPALNAAASRDEIKRLLLERFTAPA